jgi:NTE family protein
MHRFFAVKFCVRAIQALLILGACGPLFAQPVTGAAPDAARQRVGLVLGGGGARGAAHVGVLQVLEKLRIPVDCVAGTSMGALVAAAYASGIAPQQMAKELAQADWTDLFQDNPGFADTAYRQKRLSQRFIPGSELGLGVDGLVAPPGVLTGQKIKLFFNTLVRADIDERPIEALPLPLSILATDIGNGKRVVLRDGSLTTAMRASMSVPGLMAPVDYQGSKLVDGGLVDNVPVQEVRDRCQPDVVIAINVGSPLLPPDKVGSLLSVSAQMVNILTEQNVTRSLALLRASDIYLRPDLDGISAGAFERNREAVQRGRQAAEESASLLSVLSVSQAAYDQWWRGIALKTQAPPVVDAIEITDLSRAPAESVGQHISQQAGQVLDTAKLNQDLLRIFGEGSFQSVDYSMVTERERKILRITPLEKPWGPDYVRFSLGLSSEIRHGSSYSLRASVHRTGLNSLGAESLMSAELGTQTGVAASFYQPLNRTQRLFVEPSVRLNSVDMPVYQNSSRIADYNFRTASAELGLGVNLGRFGQAKLGLTALNGRASRNTGSLFIRDAEDSQRGWFASLDLDRLDHLYFPSGGWAARLRYASYPRQGYDKLTASMQMAYKFGSFVLPAAASYTGSLGGRLPDFEVGTLGGFLTMSAFAKNQYWGDRILYGRIGAERILGKAPLGLSGDMRIGFAVEAARIGQRFTETQGKGNLRSSVLYLGGETPFGPVYLGFGWAPGARNMYLSMGLR